MSTYTTGEIAKFCDVTVRTVQYYDARGILTPAELSEGGRRLYSEDDLRKMRVICFLRELGLPINAISQLLSEEHPESVLSLLIEQQEAELCRELEERQEQLDKLNELKRGLKITGDFSVKSIGDIAYQMKRKKALHKVHMTMLAAGLPINITQWVTIILWIVKGWWIPFAVWALVAIPFSIWVSRYYFERVDYICPKCHTIFKPTFREAFFAGHTPNTRKLTCSNCGHHGFCVETVKGGDDK